MKRNVHPTEQQAISQRDEARGCWPRPQKDGAQIPALVPPSFPPIVL